jgi:hypothetical protein
MPLALLMHFCASTRAGYAAHVTAMHSYVFFDFQK